MILKTEAALTVLMKPVYICDQAESLPSENSLLSLVEDRKLPRWKSNIQPNTEVAGWGSVQANRTVH